MTTRLGASGLVALLALSACREARQEAHETHGKGDAEAKQPGVVHLSAAALARSNIRVGEAIVQPLSGALVVPAEVRLDPDRTAHITPIVQSQVASVHAKLGDDVEKGQLLAQLHSVELGEASADIEKARASVKVSEDRIARQRQLADAGVGAQRSLVEAEGELSQARAALRAAQSRARVYGGAGGGRVTSPIKGTVIERHATPGEVASTDRPLFVVADIAAVWVVGRVYEKDVGAVREGVSATVRLGAYSHRSWQGTIDFVSPVLDEATRSADIRLKLPNPERLLKPGLFGTLAVGSPDAGARSLVVPHNAVQELEGNSVVFVPEADAGEFRAVPVVTGAQARDLIEILQGLEPGQKVVAEGAFTLKSALLAGELGEGHAH
jgi:cobalt-zinc-cadmium efflux system membrane fusion protein